uniref:Uncharacterized protein n=1 Tax=Anopheles arabiensis TaxID=7173 RepID=A0A182IF33_ANOAR
MLGRDLFASILRVFTLPSTSFDINCLISCLLACSVLRKKLCKYIVANTTFLIFPHLIRLASLKLEISHFESRMPFPLDAWR